MNRLVLALDLEGTLGVSQGRFLVPRPGLYPFLEYALARFERVVVYTMLSKTHARGVVEALVEGGAAPSAFLHGFEYIDGPGGYKDLSAVPNAQEVWIVDDSPSVIHPEQKANWFQIASFYPPPQHSSFCLPEPEVDRELERIQALLEERITLEGI